MKTCPSDHRHGETSTCYNAHGCRCEDCRIAKREKRRIYDWQTRLMQGRDVYVSPVGVSRRLQALAVMGWSCEVIAQAIGSHHRPLMKARAGRIYARLSLHRRVAEFYEKHCMIRVAGHSGKITRAHAASKGWVGPLAWDDIDDPAEVPDVGGTRANGVDRELVEQLWVEGLSDSVIADRLGCSSRSVWRVRRELGLETKYAA